MTSAGSGHATAPAAPAAPAPHESPVAVVGIGADGWDGLAPAARTAIADARVLLGAARQLALVPSDATTAERRAWPSPMSDLHAHLPALADDGGLTVLASGDPMLHGVGTTLAGLLGAERLRVHPHASAFQLACARLGWAAAEVDLVSAVARPVDLVARALQPGRRIVTYVTGADGAARVAEVLRDRGHGPSRLIIGERLGAADERLTETTAAAYPRDARADALHLVAIEVRPAAGVPLLPCTPGLPDDAFDHDGQLTKRQIRALTVCALQPTPGGLLWDVGAGSGAVGIEWLRAEPSARALALEPRPDRAARARENARVLGVPERLDVTRGTAPEALERLARPDAIFVGGGVSAPGVLDACWAALLPGGRIVANAVTIEAEHAVVAAHRAHGGRLTRIGVAHADALGTFTTFRPQLTVTQWAATKAEEQDP